MKHTVINYVNNYFKNVEEIDYLYFFQKRYTDYDRRSRNS